MLIAEEYLLLALDEKTGKLRVGSDVLGPALGGALITELALKERIGVTPHEAGWNQRGRVTITSMTPTDDPELDAALDKPAENEGRKVKDLLSAYSTKKRRLSHGVRERLLERLAASGTLVKTEVSIFGFIPARPGRPATRRGRTTYAGGCRPRWSTARRRPSGPSR